MFPENIVQATIEQVKTTRGLFDLIVIFLCLFVGLICVEYSYSYNNLTQTNITKVRFNTRFVAGGNFLGEKYEKHRSLRKISEFHRFDHILFGIWSDNWNDG